MGTVDTIGATSAVSSYYYTGTASSINAYEQAIALEEEEASLLNVQNATSTSGTTVDSSLLGADLLDLSPQALQVLNGLDSNTNNATTGLNATGLNVNAVAINTATGVNSTGVDTLNVDAAILDELSITQNSLPGVQNTLTSNDSNLTLSQQQNIAAIVAPYANQPLTPTTVNQIDTALTQAGYNPQQLSLQEILFAYAAFVPTQYVDPALANATLEDDLLDA